MPKATRCSNARPAVCDSLITNVGLNCGQLVKERDNGRVVGKTRTIIRMDGKCGKR